MLICYLDEAGCTGCLPGSDSPIQPVFVPAGVILDAQHLPQLTLDFLRIKRRFYPRRMGPRFLDAIRAEIKGSEIRAHVAGRRGDRRHALGVLDAFMSLLEKYQAKLIGRVWVKEIGRENSNRALYTSSVQAICSYFHHLLNLQGSSGILIADARRKHQNSDVSHSVFTQKFSAAGDRLARLIEIPTYGHNENHVGLQLADWLCSALLFPLATYSYCRGHIRSVHVSDEYGIIRDRFGRRLMRLQYRYQQRGRYIGGLVVSDGLAHRSGGLLFGSSSNA